MKALQIPEDVIDEVVEALNRAINLAQAKAPESVNDFAAVAMRLDEAINDAEATEP
jgi:formiminotetrahydrofolate cyclodeaminase